MPTWLKVVLGVLLAGVLLVAGLAAAGYYAFTSHREQLVNMGKAATTEGHQFGTGKSAPACIDEGLKRVRGVGLIDEVKVRIFAGACLQTAQRPDGFCTAVPESSSFLETAQWRLSQCSGKPGLEPQQCQRFMQAWQDACHPPAEREPAK